MQEKILQEIGFPSRNNVYIKRPEILLQTLQNMAQDGINNLQIVCDFDRTITKQHEDGVPHISSFGIFSKIPALIENEQYQNTVKFLKNKYYPIEIDPTIPRKEKIKYMEEWWSLSEKALCGLQIPQDQINSTCWNVKTSLRDGTKKFFSDLCYEDVPVLVFSAGCGDIVAAILKHSGVYLSNVRVISNFLKYDEEGKIMGFKEKIIHVFNKNEYVLKDSDIHKEILQKQNAIVLGDSLGDADMTEGMDNIKNVIKIGFLYEHVDQSLQSYMDTFDIVLVDDQTMEVPMAIFEYFKKSSK